MGTAVYFPCNRARISPERSRNRVPRQGRWNRAPRVNATVAPAQPGCYRPDSSSACRLIQDLKDLRTPEHAILEGEVEGATYAVADAPGTGRMLSPLPDDAEPPMRSGRSSTSRSSVTKKDADRPGGARVCFWSRSFRAGAEPRRRKQLANSAIRHKGEDIVRQMPRLRTFWAIVFGTVCLAGLTACASSPSSHEQVASRDFRSQAYCLIRASKTGSSEYDVAAACTRDESVAKARAETTYVNADLDRFCEGEATYGNTGGPFSWRAYMRCVDTSI